MARAGAGKLASVALGGEESVAHRKAPTWRLGSAFSAWLGMGK